MLKIVGSAVALATTMIAGTAFAADLPVKAPPMRAAVSTWTGCYLGGNVGGAWSRQDQTRTDQIGGAVGAFDYGSDRASGFTGGGQIGCDYQFAPAWVAGIRAQFDWANLSASHALPSFPTFTMFDRTKSFGTVTGRLGYVIQPAVLWYGQGGVAWVRTDDFLNQPTGALSESARWSSAGWTVGTGLEWMLKPNWSLFAEYNYMDFGTHSIQFNAPAGLLPVGEHINVRQTVQTALVGLNYRFNFGR